jgi:hypothetical protein
MSVHILGSGFCQECQGEMEWKNAPRIHKEQMEKKVRMQYYEKGEEYVKKKWKEKYGDDDVDTVRGYNG